MIVKSIKEPSYDNSIKYGQTYYVFSILFFKSSTRFIMQDSIGSTALIESEYFSIENPHINSWWEYTKIREGKDIEYDMIGPPEYASYKFYKNYVENYDDSHSLLAKEQIIISQNIDKDDFVRLRYTPPASVIKDGAYGMVKSVPDYPLGEYGVEFYDEQGNPFPLVTLPRQYLALDTKM